MMNCIAKVLLATSLLVLLDGTISTAEANIAGRFIGINDLTRAERSAVNRLTKSSGKKPWIIWGFRQGHDPKPDVDRTSLSVYLRSDAQKGRLLLGRLFAIVFESDRAAASPARWRVESVSKYAHVALADPPRSEIPTKWDLARPFSVPDDLDDEAIVSLADFIRSSPVWDELPDHLGPRTVPGAVPIVSVRHLGSGFQVCLQNKEWQGVYVDVVRLDGSWDVRRISEWIS